MEARTVGIWVSSLAEFRLALTDRRKGATPDVLGTPTEDIGYSALSRGNSPNPIPAALTTLRSRPSSSSQHHAESPLRKTSFPVNESGHLQRLSGDDHALESDMEDDHDGPVNEREGTRINEHGHRVPILAEDELKKYPSGEYLQPAVDPEQERRFNEYNESDHHRRRGSEGHSRPSSRPSSMHGAPLSRFISQERHEGSGIGTPLEEIEEYEPLFPEDDDKTEKPKTLADNLKRPDLARHHFPSQDIWEDTPTSLQYTTTVDSPQLPEDKDKDKVISPDASKVFEHPDKEQNRKDELLPSDRASFLTDETNKMAKSHFKPGVVDEMHAPPMRRFPSRDIWEDSPDSMRLETTVGGPQQEEITSPPDAKAPPMVPARPARQPGPQVPARPGASTETSPIEKKGPMIPDRPKPQVPARPARDGGEGAPLSKVTSASSLGSEGSSSTVTSPPVAKAKPAVPSRPGGSKLAALKAGFMNDLNSRLQLGPQGPPPKIKEPEEETEEDKAPLADARKGRARGPARRKPAVTPSAGESSSGLSLSFSGPHTLFQIAEDDELQVPSRVTSGSTAAENQVEEPAEATIPAAVATESRSAPEDDTVALTGMTAEAVGFRGDKPDPHISAATVERQHAITPILQEALASNAKDAGVPSAVEAAEPKSEVAPSEHTGSETSSAAPVAAEEENQSGGMVDSSVQTGTHELKIKSPQGDEEKMTTYLGGKAPDEGNVVVHENGEEHVGGVQQETPRKIGMTGHGM